MIVVKPVVPTFETLQWTGSNQSECEDFIDARAPETVTYDLIVDSENVNTLHGVGTAYFSIFVPLNHHIVFGPIYGANRTQASLDWKSTDNVETMFEEVV